MLEEFANRLNFDRYAVQIQFRDTCAAGTPNNPDTIKKWLETRGKKWAADVASGKVAAPASGSVEEETLKQIQETADSVPLTEEDCSWNVFKRDAHGLYIEQRHIKACIRECTVGLGLTRRAPLGTKQDVREYCSIKPCRWVNGDPVLWKPGDDEQKFHFLDQDGDYLTEPDDSLERPISVKTPKGQMSALKRNDVMERRFMGFELRFLAGTPALASRESRPSVDEVKDVLALMQEIGLGADRSQCSGKFDIIAFKILESHPRKKPPKPSAKDVEKEAQDF